MVFWKAPDFSAGAVKPVNMIDEERDAYPALLCSISSFREIHSFSCISVGKIHLSFSRVWRGSHGFVTASRVRTQQPISRRSLGAQWLDYHCFILASTRSLAASRRNIQGSDFSLFTLCSIAFLTGTNGTFSPLYFCWSYLFKRAGAGHIAVDFSMAIRSVRTWQNPTFKRAENLIKRNIQIGTNLSNPDF